MRASQCGQRRTWRRARRVSGWSRSGGLEGVPAFGGWIANDKTRIFLVVEGPEKIDQAVKSFARIGIEGNVAAGRPRRKVDPAVVARLDGLGLSGIANVVAAIKLAKYLKSGPDSVFITVATDGAELYGSEREGYAAQEFPDGMDEVNAAELYARHMLAATTDNLLELTRIDRDRIFNLGYYTWVEQQGIALDAFDSRRDQSFWTGLTEVLPKWDALIEETNRRTGLAA